MGFGNESADWNLATKGDGTLQFANFSQKVSVYGGVGQNNPAGTSAGGVYPVGSTFRAEFTYYTNNTVDVVVNGTSLWTGLAVTSTVGNNLDYAYLATYLQDVPGGGTFDNLVIETIPEPASVGLVAAAGALFLFIRRRFLI